MMDSGESLVADVPPGAAALVDATAGRAAAAFFGAASYARRKRSLHPDGAAFEAFLSIDPPRPIGARLLDRPDESRCVVRLSRAVGLPERVRDILGLAIRVLDAGGRTRQDLLFSTVAGDGRLGRHVLAPAGSFAEQPLSTILPYRTAGARVTLLARGAGPPPAAVRTLESAAEAFAAGELRFVVLVTDGRHVTGFGHLCGGPRLPAEESEALRFNPYHAEADLQPTGLLNAARRRAYAASQRRRAGRPRRAGRFQ